VVSELSIDLSASIFSERRQKLLAQRHDLTSEKLAHWHSFMSEIARPTTQPHISAEVNLQQHM
jgi:hypothetical protein